MKKIYSLAAGLIFCGSMLAQGTFVPFNSPYHAARPAKPLNSEGNSRVLGPKYWVEPVGDVMTSLGIDLTGASSGQSQDTFLDIVYMDSTTRVSDPNGTRTIGTIMLGSVLDPKSPNLDPTFTPILSASDPYTIDSLAIYGSYVQVDPSVTDTLYTWLVWGDTSTASVFVKRLTNTIWVAPISSWRYSIIGPKVTGAVGAAGNKVKAAAPASNMRLIKRLLTSADAAAGPGSVTAIYIDLAGAPVNIPAGKIASCFYTFVPGAPHTLGDVSYSFTGSPDPQTVNGFAGLIWNQTSPAVGAVTDYENQQVDPDGFNMGATYYMEQRHALYPASYDNSLWGNLTTAPLIAYSLYSNSSVGVNEDAAGFTLGQNTPNPFNNVTKISYKLKNSAENVSLAIYNVAGVKVFEKNQSNLSAGSYSVDVNADFSAGMYFYSLTVDGNKVTKKMTVTK